MSNASLGKREFACRLIVATHMLSISLVISHCLKLRLPEAVIVVNLIFATDQISAIQCRHSSWATPSDYFGKLVPDELHSF